VVPPSGVDPRARVGAGQRTISIAHAPIIDQAAVTFGAAFVASTTGIVTRRPAGISGFR
jgi:hypothetical protein